MPFDIFGNPMPDLSSGGFTPDTLKAKRALAAAMLQQGTGEGIIKSPWQGLARMANAALGGYDLYKADVDELGGQQAQQDALAGMIKQSMPGSGATGAVPTAPAGPVAPGTGGDEDFISGLKKREAFRPNAYADGRQTSIGYGTRAKPGETTITEEEADKRLRDEEGASRQLVRTWANRHGVQLAPKQEDALTDLTFNAGGAWMTAGLGAAVRAGNIPAAQALYKLYINSPVPNTRQGLLNRRTAMAPLLADTSPAAIAPNPDEAASFAGGVNQPGGTEERPGLELGAPATPQSAGLAPPAAGNPAAVQTPGAQMSPLDRSRAYVYGLLTATKPDGTPDNAKRRMGQQLATSVAKDLLSPKEDEWKIETVGTDVNGNPIKMQYNSRTQQFRPVPAATQGGVDTDQLMGEELRKRLAETEPQTLAQVDKIISGEIPITANPRKGHQERIQRLAVAMEPGADFQTYAQRAGVRADFTKGGPNSVAGTITNGNSAIGHLGLLSDAAKELKNFDSGIPGNNLMERIRNWAKTSSGTGFDLATFETVKDRFVEEATKFYRGAGGNEADIQRSLALLDAAKSPGELQSAIRANVQLMKEKVEALQQRWHAGMDTPTKKAPDFEIIHEKSRAAIERIGKNYREATGRNPETGLKDEAAAPAATQKPSNQAEIDQSLANARAAIKSGKWTREQAIQKLQAAGVDTKGL